jgi:hypothetical protein
MDPPDFWAHDAKLYISKRHLVKLGWQSDSQSSKKLKGFLKPPTVLGMVLAPKFSGGRAPCYVDVDVVAKMVILGKREEACAIIGTNICGTHAFSDTRAAPTQTSNAPCI